MIIDPGSIGTALATWLVKKLADQSLATVGRRRLAKAAAGDRDVLVHGAYTAQRAFEAGVLDEVYISLVPVLFGGGRRLIEVLPSRIEMDIVRVVDTPEATHIRYRIRR